jgi:hypothetical protein
MPTKEELLEKSKKPSADALKMHPFFKGKIASALKCCVRDFNDFAIWYTPGVAAACRDIEAHPEKVFEHTNKANMVAVVSDGTRVLGLGDIGPEAAIPVMEGKAILFKYLGGVDAWPICLDTKDAEEIIRTVKLISPCFGGINLEDFSQPKCFHILDTLRKEAKIPIWHDDQQGTAAVTLAGLFNALKVVGKKLETARLTLLGSGAANIATARILIAATAIVKDGGLGDDLSDLPVAGAAPEWMSEKALSIGQYFVGSGVFTVFGVTWPTTGSREVTDYLFKDYEAIYGGLWAFESDPIKTAQLMIAHIDKKRKALGIDKARERVLYDMEMRRELEAGCEIDRAVKHHRAEGGSHV